jgi:RNA polymerase sigma-70 factor (ECF subfamily)
MHSALCAQLLPLLPRLRRFARGLAGSDEEGDELLQDACARAISRAHQWLPGTRLDSWMYRTIQTIWLDRLRVDKVRGRNAGALDPDKLIGGDLQRECEARLLLDEVRRAIGRLPPEQRAVLLLVCVEGLSYREAADTLDLPIGTVMSRLCRARLALAHMLDSAQGSAVDSPPLERLQRSGL